LGSSHGQYGVIVLANRRYFQASAEDAGIGYYEHQGGGTNVGGPANAISADPTGQAVAQLSVSFSRTHEKQPYSPTSLETS
jgi:hypothetical protein